MVQKLEGSMGVKGMFIIFNIQLFEYLLNFTASSLFSTKM